MDFRQLLSNKIFILLMAFLVLAVLGIGFYLYQGGQLFPQQEQKINFESCPVKGDICLDTKEANDKGVRIGFGYTLPEGTEVYTPVSGEISFGRASSPNESYVGVRIADPRGYLITYYFKGTTIAESNFYAPAGTLVGKTAESINSLGGLNLVVEIRDQATGKIILLDAKEILKNAQK